MYRVFYIFLIVLLYSCQEDKPYHEFEEKLVNAVCKCISLKKNTSDDNFLIEYEKCSRNTSALLKTGLEHYPEDPRLSKEDYKAQLPTFIKQLNVTNRCATYN